MARCVHAPYLLPRVIDAGALCCRAACEWLRHTAAARNSDDACEVFGLHGTGGLVGNALTPVFAATAFGGTQAVASVPKQARLKCPHAASTSSPVSAR